MKWLIHPMIIFTDSLQLRKIKKNWAWFYLVSFYPKPLNFLINNFKVIHFTDSISNTYNWFVQSFSLMQLVITFSLNESVHFHWFSLTITSHDFNQWNFTDSFLECRLISTIIIIKIINNNNINIKLKYYYYY